MTNLVNIPLPRLTKIILVNLPLKYFDQNYFGQFTFEVIWPKVFCYFDFCLTTPIFYKKVYILRSKAFLFSLRGKIGSKKGFFFSLRSILLLKEAFTFCFLKISSFWGKRKLKKRFKKQKSVFKIIKKIFLLKEAFSRSVLLFMKKWVYS